MPKLGHRLIMSDPNSDCSEFDGCEVVVVAPVVARGDGAEVLDLAEEPFDGVA